MKNSPYYEAIGKEVEVFNHSYQQKLPLLLKGPTGTGKSRFIEYMAHSFDKELITVSCHEETSSTDLIGRYIIKGAETVWLDGPLTTAVKTGAILYLDEIAEARPDVLVAIHSLTDHRRELFIDKLGLVVKAHENFMLVASFNPGYQKGFKDPRGNLFFDICRAITELPKMPRVVMLENVKNIRGHDGGKTVSPRVHPPARSCRGSPRPASASASGRRWSAAGRGGGGLVLGQY